MKDEVVKLCQELVRERGDQEHGRKSELGLSRLKLWIQHVPQEMLLMYMESDDIEETNRRWRTEAHDHDSWLQERLNELLDHQTHMHSEGPISELVYDWHPEHGPATDEHRS